jgi:hypothetical protein
MDDSADLIRALRFVSKQVESEADRSGQLLSDEQRFLLNHLPDSSSSLATYGGGGPEIVEPLVPRDLDYERLSDLVKAARRASLRLAPQSEAEWRFAAAVLKLRSHPMSWLLQTAGVKAPRSRWDRWLLLASALLLIFIVMISIWLGGNRKLAHAASIAVYILALAALVYVSRRLEQWHLKRIVDSYRDLSTFTH